MSRRAPRPADRPEVQLCDGVDCQKADWRKHKPKCRAIKAESDRLEARALTDRTLTALDADLDPYWESIEDEVGVAKRSAFKYGRPDALWRTHTLELSFTYHPEKTTLRERFVLDDCIMTPTPLILIKWGDTEATRTCLIENILKEVIGDGLGHRAEYKTDLFGAVVSNIYYTTGKGRIGCQHHFHATHCTSAVRYDLPGTPLEKRRLNPDWKAFLKSSLAAPSVGKMMSELEDLIQSEGDQEAMRMIEAAGIPQMAAKKKATDVLERLSRLKLK